MLKRTIPITLILLWTIALFIPGHCLAQNESEATYTVIEELDVKVTMRGYVAEVQDTRGRGESEGIFNANQHEALYGYDTQQWIGEQAWCNRKIGTFRLDLFTPWSIEMTHPNSISSSFLAEKMDIVLMTLPLIEQDRSMESWRNRLSRSLSWE